MTGKTSGAPNQTLLRLVDLPTSRPTRITLDPNAVACAAIAIEIGALAVRKLRFAATLTPAGKGDWQLSAHLGATVIQPCVVSLAPVTTRIDETVTRRYSADANKPAEPGESEMLEDETLEPLPETLDLATVMSEALALALPIYPRADGVEIGQAIFTEPGATPLTDEAAKPFAGLGALRDKLKE